MRKWAHGNHGHVARGRRGERNAGNKEGRSIVAHEMHLGRRVAAQALVVAAGVGVASNAFQLGHVYWQPLACGAVVALGGLALGLNSMLAQIFGRAAT